MEGRLGDYDRPATLAEAYAGLDRVVFIPAGREPNAVRDVLATFLQ